MLERREVPASAQPGWGGARARGLLHLWHQRSIIYAMFGTAHRERIEGKLDALLTDLAALTKRVGEIEAQEFGLVELRRQARNAVRSLERATANAQEARQGTNGDGDGIAVPPGTDPISARILARRSHRGLSQRAVP